MEDSGSMFTAGQRRSRSVLTAVRSALGGVLLLSILFGTARADRRLFVWTYQAQTMKRGEAEIESYTTFSSAELGDATGRTSANLQLELETGMTDRFDFGLYQVFAQEAGQPLIYDGYKLRFRYHLWETGRLPFASVAYLEYKGKLDYSAHAFELKWIAARRVGRFLLAINPTAELEQEGSEWEMEPEYAAGATWIASELLNVGLEAKGNEDAHYLGPVLGHGVGDLWVALGSAFRVSGEEDVSSELETRLLIGLGIK